jgi:hypothetical protein
MDDLLTPRSFATLPDFFMAITYTAPTIDEYLRKRLVPVEGAIPYVLSRDANMRTHGGIGSA